MTLPQTYTTTSYNTNRYNHDMNSQEHHQPQQQPYQQQYTQQYQPQQQQHQEQQQCNYAESNAIMPISLPKPIPQQTTNAFAANFTGIATALPSTSPAVSLITDSAANYVEQIMPGILYSKNFSIWNEQNLNELGFRNMIIIDKHLQELHCPAPLFKLCPIVKPLPVYENSSDYYNDDEHISTDYQRPTEASIAAEAAAPRTGPIEYGPKLEAINLNFGDKNYVTTVLPNCYRAVRFINKTRTANKPLLIIDCNDDEQKCLTIVVAYLMYKQNLSSREALGRLKQYYKKAELNAFYSNQLYEYEPILKVQRSSSCGHSCSREMRAALLKRKNVQIDDANGNNGFIDVNAYSNRSVLANENPLGRFNPMQQNQQEQHATYGNHPQAIKEYQQNRKEYEQPWCEDSEEYDYSRQYTEDFEEQQRDESVIQHGDLKPPNKQQRFELNIDNDVAMELV